MQVFIWLCILYIFSVLFFLGHPVDVSITRQTHYFCAYIISFNLLSQSYMQWSRCAKLQQDYTILKQHVKMSTLKAPLDIYVEIRRMYVHIITWSYRDSLQLQTSEELHNVICIDHLELLAMVFIICTMEIKVSLGIHI